MFTEGKSAISKDSFLKLWWSLKEILSLEEEPEKKRCLELSGVRTMSCLDASRPPARSGS